MMKNKIMVLLPVMMVVVAFILAGCDGITNTVGTCIVSGEQYTEKAALKSAEQPESVKAGQEVYASVRFIESPLGMEYTGKWYMDNTEVKTETKETTKDKTDIIIYVLEADNVNEGILRFEITYGDDVLFSKELSVQ